MTEQKLTLTENLLLKILDSLNEANSEGPDLRVFRNDIRKGINALYDSICGIKKSLDIISKQLDVIDASLHRL
jgi:hypothetical protein